MEGTDWLILFEMPRFDDRGKFQNGGRNVKKHARYKFARQNGILPSDSNCSGTFRSIRLEGHSMHAFTEVDEGLSTDFTRFSGVDVNKGEVITGEGIGVRIGTEG